MSGEYDELIIQVVIDLKLITNADVLGWFGGVNSTKLITFKC